MDLFCLFFFDFFMRSKFENKKKKYTKNKKFFKKYRRKKACRFVFKVIVVGQIVYIGKV